MASTKISIPKYRLHRGSGQAFVQIKGKRHYLGIYDSPESKERYARFINELAVNPQPSAIPDEPVDGITVAELAVAYLDHAEVYYRKNNAPTRRVGIISRILSLLGELYGLTPAQDFGPLALRAIQQNLVRRKIGRGFINDQMRVIVGMFKWGVSLELVPAAVYQALATVPALRAGRSDAKEGRHIGPVSDAAVDATVPYLTTVVSSMVRFQRLTGSRPGEVVQLRPMDLDRSGAVWEYRPASHKTEHHGKARTIYIGPQAQAILAPFLERDAAAYCFSPAESEAERLAGRAESHVLHVVRTADGHAKEIALGDLPGDPQDGNRPPALWSLAVDGDSGRAAAGLGSSRMGMVILYDLASGARQTVLDGFPTWVKAVRFVGPGRLLTGTYGGRVQLWDLKEKKPLWTTETKEEVVQFGFVRGGPYAVCVHLCRSASLLRLQDGAVVRRTRRLMGSDSSVVLPWVHPALVGDGTLTLEMAPDAMQLRLVDAATGAARLTFCAMPEDQWIVYTPEGAWDGSGGIHAWVKFYRRFGPLALTEADKNRSRAKIEAALQAAFGRSETNVSIRSSAGARARRSSPGS